MTTYYARKSDELEHPDKHDQLRAKLLAFIKGENTLSGLSQRIFSGLFILNSYVATHK